MAWSSFTANLAEGDLITEAQRNELYDAFLERAGAVDRFLAHSYAASSDLRNSRFATDLVERASAAPVRLSAALADLSAYYLQASKVDSLPATDTSDVLTFNGSGSENLLYQAATGLGYATDLFTDGELQMWKKWNILREAIRLLKYPLIATTLDGLATFTKHAKTAEEASWADTRSSFLAAGESSPGPGYPADYYLVTYMDGAFFEIRGRRAGYSLTIPATTPFSSGHRLVGWLSRDDAGYLDKPVTAEYGGASVSVSSTPLASDLACAYLSTTGRTAIGSQSLEVKLTGYTDDSALAEFDPTGDDSFDSGGSVKIVAAIPTFTQT